MSKFNPTNYKNEFAKEKYDRVSLVLPKGEKERLKAHADKYDGGSLNAFLKRAIELTIKSDINDKEEA